MPSAERMSWAYSLDWHREPDTRTCTGGRIAICAVGGRRDRGAVRAAVRRPSVPRAADCIARTTRRTRCSFRTLLSIKTGGCPEDCGYCPQAARYHTGVADEALLDVAAVVAAAQRGEGERRDALLHGRGVARAEGARPRAGARDGARQ